MITHSPQAKNNESTLLDRFEYFKPVSMIRLLGIILFVACSVPTVQAVGSDTVFASFEGYKPVYILNSWFMDREGSEQGYHDQELAIQISLKKQLVSSLYFGYSHKVFWQIYDLANSRPFREQNYNPELFLDYRRQWGVERLRIGLEHESNGERMRFDENGEPVNYSRTWDRAYLFLQKQATSFLSISLKAWVVTSPKTDECRAYYDDNPDMQQYMGSGELGLRIEVSGVLTNLMLRRGWRDGTETVRMDIQVPIRLFREKTNSENALHLQAFSGYGDSLIDYDRKVTRLAVGISFH
jgi:phospholipase A1/A2